MVHIPEYFLPVLSPDEGGGAPGFHQEEDPVVLRGASTVNKAVVDIFAAQPGDGFPDDSEVKTERKAQVFDFDWAWENLRGLSAGPMDQMLTYLNHFGWTKELYKEATSYLKQASDLNILPLLRACKARKLTAAAVERAIQLRANPDEFADLLSLGIWFSYPELDNLSEGANMEQREAVQIEVIEMRFGSN